MDKRITVKSASEIKIGSYMVDYFANSIAFYKVVKTTAKTISIQRVRSKEVKFECTGGPTGYSTIVPTDIPYYGEGTKIERKIAQKNEKTGNVYFSASIGYGSLDIYNPEHEYSEYYE